MLGNYNGISRTRTIDIPGLATRAAESDNAAWTLSVGGELGLNLDQPTQVATAPIDRYGVNVQLGIELASIKGMTAFIAFDGAWLTGKQRYGGQVGVFVPF